MPLSERLRRALPLLAVVAVLAIFALGQMAGAPTPSSGSASPHTSARPSPKNGSPARALSDYVLRPDDLPLGMRLVTSEAVSIEGLSGDLRATLEKNGALGAWSATFTGDAPNAPSSVASTAFRFRNASGAQQTVQPAIAALLETGLVRNTESVAIAGLPVWILTGEFDNVDNDDVRAIVVVLFVTGDVLSVSVLESKTAPLDTLRKLAVTLAERQRLR